MLSYSTRESLRTGENAACGDEAAQAISKMETPTGAGWFDGVVVEPEVEPELAVDPEVAVGPVVDAPESPSAPR
jgi:hypothetical protein